MAWILFVVYFHRLAHTYQSDIVEVLNSPVLRLAATTVLLTGLVYFVVLSLPFVPNLGPRSVGMVFVWTMLLVVGHSLSHMGFHDAQAMLSAMRDAVGAVASYRLRSRTPSRSPCLLSRASNWVYSSWPCLAR